ncbi:MAG: HisA/HisF-related TIM barrel protein [Methylotenera sp.]|nr:HisA/HisF-related TIM barrel protein [Methylotenera sp.]MDO9233538.1 HisA/HisF-related TIM barrel protein [Methylotenera sp.]MDO9387973.1 HisA/HisF-related TIM barrel protein [Methylotenera sp.]MDP2103111.1 HisA/HisF-related TIM barrel protein [Methylotenera sp.]MDP2280070.1 HisA/HisF-related TIM barrel protein [Methylotenera sp.]
MMQVIPVIDLLNGVVVHAKKGGRQHYQAIQSSLTTSSQPLDIVAALLDLFPFEQLYIADLNAIQKLEKIDTSNYNVIESIAQQFPHLKLWVDAGVSNNIELNIWKNLDIRIVLGSENFVHLSNFTSLNRDHDFVLSLDFMPQGYQGPMELLTQQQLWPQDVIVMSLENVGANQGVNSALLKEIVGKANSCNVYAAGGIRGSEDLAQLKKMGVHGALVATALHLGQLSKSELNTYA